MNKVLWISLGVIIGIVVTLVSYNILNYSSLEQQTQESVFESPQPQQSNQTSFTMKDSLSCYISETNDSKSDNKGFLLSNLFVDQPILSTENGDFTLTKTKETNSLLIISFASPTSGSTDVITLDKNTGVFQRETKGNFPGLVHNFWLKGYCN